MRGRKWILISPLQQPAIPLWQPVVARSYFGSMVPVWHLSFLMTPLQFLTHIIGTDDVCIEYQVRCHLMSDLQITQNRGHPKCHQKVATTTCGKTTQKYYDFLYLIDSLIILRSPEWFGSPETIWERWPKANERLPGRSPFISSTIKRRQVRLFAQFIVLQFLKRQLIDPLSVHLLLANLFGR